MLSKTCTVPPRNLSARTLSLAATMFASRWLTTTRSPGGLLDSDEE